MKMIFGTNNRRHIESNEYRDRLTRSMRQVSLPREGLRSVVNLRPWMTPVENQLETSACYANAFAGVCEYLIKRDYGIHIDVSRLFIYFNARRQHVNHTGLVVDGGIDQRSVAVGLQKYGCCEEKTWPYIIENKDVRPSDRAYKEAHQWTVVPLRIPCTVDAIERCLHNRLPVVIDVILMEEAGIIYHPSTRGSRTHNVHTGLIDQTALHSVVIVGYNRHTRYFYARNSYGENWGDEGYFYMPYSYLSDRRLVNSSDGCWTIRKIVRRRDNKIPTIHRLVLTNQRTNQRKNWHYYN